MFSFLGLLMGIGVMFLIGTASGSKDLIALESRDLHKFDGVRKDEDSTIIYANRAPLKTYIKISIFLIGLIVLMVGPLIIDGGLDEFVLMVFILLMGAFGPFFLVFIIKYHKLKKTVQTRQPILEFHKDGMICHSDICGPVQEISWFEIKNYTPVLPAFGTVSSIEISYHDEGLGREIISRYVLNTIAIDLASLVTLLEHYSDIPANEAR